MCQGNLRLTLHYFKSFTKFQQDYSFEITKLHQESQITQESKQSMCSVRHFQAFIFGKHNHVELFAT